MSHNKIKILVLESKEFSSEAMSILNGIGQVHTSNLAKLHDLDLSEYSVIWVRLGLKLSESFFEKASNLQYLVTATTGLDHIDLKAAESRNIKVLSLKGEFDFLSSVRATAEHTIALMLSLLRDIPAAVDYVKTGDWRRGRDLFKGSELLGKVVGIIGYGRLGKIVSRYLQVFGCHVLAYDVDHTKRSEHKDIHFVELEELLEKSDIVSIHVNLEESNRGFYGRECFSKMKKGAVLINTSRGALLDEQALLEFLQNKHLAGAALDVIANEYGDSSTSEAILEYMRQNRNLVITPHIGGCTHESMTKTETFAAQKLAKAISGEI